MVPPFRPQKHSCRNLSDLFQNEFFFDFSTKVNLDHERGCEHNGTFEFMLIGLSLTGFGGLRVNLFDDGLLPTEGEKE